MGFLRNRKGFTFIELVVAMAIVGILGGSVAGLLKTGLSSYRKISDDMYSETEARTALSLITVKLRQYDEIDAILVNSPTYLTFRQSPGDAGTPGLKVWFDSVENCVYAQDYSDLSDISTAGPQNPIAHVFDLSVVRTVDSGGTVLYDISITYGSSGNTRQLKQTVAQRSALLAAA